MKAQPIDNRATRGAKRARVLQEAAKALNARGVSQTSLTDIAQRVGVSRAALYYYFEDQQDLVFQSYRRSCEIMARRLNEATHGPGDAQEVIEAFVEGVLAEGEPEIAVLSEIAFLRPDQRSTILGLYKAIMAGIAEILDAGARRGELRPCRSGVVAPAIVGLISWIPMVGRLRSVEAPFHEARVKAIKDLLRWGWALDRAAPAEYRMYDLAHTELPLGEALDAETMARAKQEALLASASWLFNLKGIDATSLEEIAQQLGVTKKVIYHNVGDKTALVTACYRRSFRFFENIAARIHLYEGSRIDAFSAAIHTLAEGSLREEIAPLAPLGGFEALPDTVRAELNDASIRLMDSYLKLLVDGAADGSMRAAPPRGFLAVLPGAFEWLPKWFDIMDGEERAAAGQELALLTRVGLQPLSRRPPV